MDNNNSNDFNFGNPYASTGNNNSGNINSGNLNDGSQNFGGLNTGSINSGSQNIGSFDAGNLSAGTATGMASSGAGQTDAYNPGLNSSNTFNAGTSSQGNPASNTSSFGTSGQQTGLYGQPAPAQSNFGNNGYGQNTRDFYYQGNPAQNAPKPKEPGQGLAVAALVCGILSILLACTFGIGSIFSVIAIILAIIAGKKGNKSGAKKGGIVTGIIGLIITVITVVCLFVFMGAVLKEAGVEGDFKEVIGYVGDSFEVMSAFRKAAKDPKVKKNPDYKDALDELEDGIVLNGYDPEDNCIVEKAYDIMGEDKMEEFLETSEEYGGWIVVTMDGPNSVEISFK